MATISNINYFGNFFIKRLFWDKCLEIVLWAFLVIRPINGWSLYQPPIIIFSLFKNNFAFLSTLVDYPISGQSIKKCFLKKYNKIKDCIIKHHEFLFINLKALLNKKSWRSIQLIRER